MKPGVVLGGSDSDPLVSPSRIELGSAGCNYSDHRLLLFFCGARSAQTEAVFRRNCASQRPREELKQLDLVLPLTFYRTEPRDVLGHQSLVLVFAVDLHDLLSTVTAPGSGQG